MRKLICLLMLLVICLSLSPVYSDEYECYNLETVYYEETEYPGSMFFSSFSILFESDNTCILSFDGENCEAVWDTYDEFITISSADSIYYGLFQDDKFYLQIEDYMLIFSKEHISTESDEKASSIADVDLVIFEQKDIVIRWRGLKDTLTSGLDFQPVLLIENNSSESISISPESFYINGYLQGCSNMSTISLEPESKFILTAQYIWLFSAEDLINLCNIDTITDFGMNLTIKQGKKTVVQNQKFNIETNINIYDLMKENSFFTKSYNNSTGSSAPLDFSLILFDKQNIVIRWGGFLDTHTSGLDFQPVLLFENSSAKTVSISADSFYINGYLIGGSNIFTITLEPNSKFILPCRNIWLFSAEDLLDTYNEKIINNFRMTLTIKIDKKVIVKKQKFVVDTDIDIYELMSTNSYFIDKYGK